MPAVRRAEALSAHDFDVVLCDLDGVVWLAHHAISGAADGIARLRAAGARVVFVTNNSFARVGDQEAALEAIGIPAAGDVVTSAQAAAALVEPEARVLVCGGPGVVEALAERGAEPVEIPAGTGDPDPVDAVIVGFHRSFDYERMRQAAAAVRLGARLIGTNDDATYPTPEGPIPGGGAILAAVATAAGATPTVAGKPHPAMAAFIRARIGASRPIMVGDRVDTDGLFAATLRCPFVLVRSGVTPPEAAVDVAAALDVADLGAAADALLGRSEPTETRR
jgi:4-nitrophenyl phosphatase